LNQPSKLQRTQLLTPYKKVSKYLACNGQHASILIGQLMVLGISCRKNFADVLMFNLVDVRPGCCPVGWRITLASSRFLSFAESNYIPYEGEALVITWGLEQTRYFTLGCHHLVVRLTKPLIKIFGDKSLADISNTRLFRLKQQTLRWHFNIIHLPGKTNTVQLMQHLAILLSTPLLLTLLALHFNRPSPPPTLKELNICPLDVPVLITASPASLTRDLHNGLNQRVVPVLEFAFVKLKRDGG